ncbi:hypothetical protein QWY13_04840 [Planococcus sp. N017]|uniref:DUF2207 domain-containing protein n=2 Tax=Planococcus shenhongbingii TaxID=3058398 RepID=A0ABT8NAA1_9BACL|nr:hypothetical protein [Planococcus sp. N017]
MMMADFREKIKTISSTNGSSAPENAKRLGMGCLMVALLAVFILTFFLAIGLFISGSWMIALVILLFFLISTAMAVLLLYPSKFDSL